VPPGVLIAGKLIPKVNPQGEAYSAFSHAASRSYTDLADNLVRMDGEQRSAYFALAAYKQGFHESPPDPKTGKTKKQLRVRTNVDSLQALWFDIDFKGKKGEPPLYPDVKSAVSALAAFCKAIKMPSPALLVGTGNGIHVYWPFDEPVPLDRWQRLADALKTAALEHHLDIDPVCTADACRVLRPIGTSNWKDPANPKPVKLLHATGKQFTYSELESVLTPWLGARRGSVANTVGNGLYTELTAGLSRKDGRFENIIKHCGVASMIADTHGKECSEPLWTWSLQLLKHCEDGEQWVHPISDHHPGYTVDATKRKWQERLDNVAGPTKCSTFEQYEPAICAKCPWRKTTTSPIQLGHDDVQVVGEMPDRWRIMPDRKGIEQFIIEATGQKQWKKILRHVPTNLRVSKSIVTGNHDVTLDIELAGSHIGNVVLPGGTVPNSRKLMETLGERGIWLKEKEVKPFIDLMNTWLEKLQTQRHTTDVTEQLGWLIEQTDDGERITGFSCGQMTYYANGSERNDVRASREYAATAKHYEPKGSLATWKKVATFLADQNNPAFTAILAAAFAAPLMRFTGLAGAVISIVSNESGVGKSSALRCSQAVWGSPKHCVNQVDDTVLSAAKKLGFLNNLPAYWDELRGKNKMEAFLNLAFQITGGKEKTRLNSAAEMKEVSTWETMLVVASNDSIFEAMAKHGRGSDAGMARTFEIVVEPFTTERNRAELSIMFGALNSNYGQAGAIYAKYLAMNAEAVGQRVEKMYRQFDDAYKPAQAERFWFAIMTLLIVGAQIAGELGLVKINVPTLAKFLMSNVQRLRSRTVDALALSEPLEILASYLAAHQNSALVVDRFPHAANLKSYIPDLTGGIPRTDMAAYQVSRTEGLLRIPRRGFEEWLTSRELSIYETLKRLRGKPTNANEIRVMIGVGTKWERPPQKVLQFKLTDLGMTVNDLKVDALSSSADIPGSPSATPPAGSPPGSSPP
jgi:Domain of unknown function (DUF927)